MPLNRTTVLILSANPAFVRELAAHWPKDSDPPEFTALEETLFRDLAGHYQLAIADVSEPGRHRELKETLSASGRPAILIHADSSLPLSHGEGTIIELRGQDGLWPVLTGLLGREILLRELAETRRREAESACAAAQAEATLGRFVVEMSHNMNNALTSILGNADLLTLEPGIPANVLAEADTIRNMALCLHEILKRFSSLEKELSVSARESAKSSGRAQSAASAR